MLDDCARTLWNLWNLKAHIYLCHCIFSPCRANICSTSLKFDRVSSIFFSVSLTRFWILLKILPTQGNEAGKTPLQPLMKIKLLLCLPLILLSEVGRHTASSAEETLVPETEWSRVRGWKKEKKRSWWSIVDYIYLVFVLFCLFFPLSTVIVPHSTTLVANKTKSKKILLHTKGIGIDLCPFFVAIVAFNIFILSCVDLRL